MVRKKINTIKKSWIDWFQLLLIAILSPLFLFPSMKLTWVFILVPLVLIWRCLSKKNFFENTVLDWAVFLLIIQVFVTCLIVPDLPFSLPKIAGVLFGIIFYYSALNLLINKESIRYGIILFLLGGMIFSFISLLGMTRYSIEYRNDLSKIYKLIPKINFNLPGAKEGFDPNAIGGTLIIILPLCIILAGSYRQRKKQNNLLNKNLFLFILLIGSIIISIVLWLTHSRGSLIASLLSIWFMLIWVPRDKKWSLILILIFLAFCILSAAFIDIPAFTKDVKNKFDLRFKTWNLAIEKISSNPIFGIGMNQFRKHPLLDYTRAHAHNHLLHTATELGIPGLIAYLAILMGTGYMCFQIWRISTIEWMRMSAVGLGYGQLAHFIFGMMDSIPLGAKVGIFFWLSLALITAIYNYTIRQSRGIG